MSQVKFTSWNVCRVCSRLKQSLKWEWELEWNEMKAVRVNVCVCVWVRERDERRGGGGKCSARERERDHHSDSGDGINLINAWWTEWQGIRWEKNFVSRTRWRPKCKSG